METKTSTLATELQHKIDTKTKPLGALGQLETIAHQVGLIQQTTSPQLKAPHMVVFAGDHGITEEGVSPFPQEVTHQMVFNFLAGGAAINVFSKQHDIALKVVDAGVNFDFDDAPNLIQAKIGYGTRNFAKEPAMTIEQCQQAIAKGREIINEINQQGSNIVGFGEMGIGNTSAAAMIMSAFTGIDIVDCVGAGTGLDANGISKKAQTLKAAFEHHTLPGSPVEKLALFGGFEMAMMTGAILEAASLRMVVMIDGFIATASLLAASAMETSVLDCCVFTHCSNEQGHRKMLDYLKAEPLLNLGMRLGEGTGAAVAYPVIASAVTFLNEMASFETAGVSEKED